MRLARCVTAVLNEIPSSAAICLLLLSATISDNTCRSRLERPPWCVTAGLWFSPPPFRLFQHRVLPRLLRLARLVLELRQIDVSRSVLGLRRLGAVRETVAIG